MRTSDENRGQLFLALFQGFQFLGNLPISLVFHEAPTGTQKKSENVPPPCRRSASSPTGTEKCNTPCGFMMFRMGGAEAFARQHVSMADNRQNDTRPIQPSQPPMASQIHPESHRPIADSPDQLAHSPKPPATPPSQWQERSAAQYDFRPVGQFPFAHAHSRQDRLSPRWHGGGRPCDQCGEATEQFQVIVLVKQIAKTPMAWYTFSLAQPPPV